MKNNDSKARTQVFFGALLFALVFMAELYIMINFPDMYIIVAALAVVDLMCLYAVINGCLSMQKSESSKCNEQFDSIFRSEKAFYLLMKKYFGEMEEKLENLNGDSSEVFTEEIINAQKAAARVVINRNRENTQNLMISCNQIITEIGEIKKLFGEYQNEIVSLQQNMQEPDDKALQIRLQDLTVDLKDMELRLSNAIMQSQKLMAQAPVMAAPVQQSVPVQMPATESVPVTESVEPEINEESESVPELEEETYAAETTEPAGEESETDGQAGTELSEVSEEAPVMPDLSDPNKALDASEIDALFASMNVEAGAGNEESEPEGTGTAEEFEPTVEEVVEDESGTDGQADEEPPEEPAEAPTMPDLSDPNKTLDASEIDALFASMNVETGEGKEESEPKEQETEGTGVAEEAEPTAEEAVGEEPDADEEPSEEPVETPIMPDLSDPNKSLDISEIDELFASMNA